MNNELDGHGWNAFFFDEGQFRGGRVNKTIVLTAENQLRMLDPIEVAAKFPSNHTERKDTLYNRTDSKWSVGLTESRLSWSCTTSCSINYGGSSVY